MHSYRSLIPPLLRHLLEQNPRHAADELHIERANAARLPRRLQRVARVGVEPALSGEEDLAAPVAAVPRPQFNGRARDEALDAVVEVRRE